MIALKWIWENMKGYRAAYIVVCIVGGLLSIAHFIVPTITGRIIDDVVEGGMTEMLFPYVAAAIGISLTRTGMKYIYLISDEFLINRFQYRLRNRLYDRLQRMDAAFYNRNRSGDLMTRMSGDIDMCRHMMGWVIVPAVECISLFFGCLFYFLFLDWRITIILMILAPISFFITKKMSKELFSAHRQVREEQTKLGTVAQENIAGNRAVKAFVREDYEIEKFDAQNKRYKVSSLAATDTWLKYAPLLQGVPSVMNLALIITGGIFVINGELTLGTFNIFMSLIWMLNDPLRRAGQLINDAQRFFPAAEKLMQLYYSEPDIKNPADPADCSKLKGGIEFKNVSFVSSKRRILDNISFKAEPGQTIAIMGPTGSGKTTLINMIPRFTDPSEGEVLIDGVNVRNYNLQQLRHKIGLASQEVFLFSDSVEGNVTFGVPDMPTEEIYQFTKAASADGFIKKLENGYDTIIGERGVGISGGQRQRLALSRALALRAPILILDDTTSAVDMETEAEIQLALKNDIAPCTKIIIAQRISSVKNADKILILSDGKIIEEGTHKELLAAKGYYYDIYMLQQGNRDVEVVR